MTRVVEGIPGIKKGVTVTTAITGGGATIGLIGADGRSFDVALTQKEAKRVAYVLLLAADGIKPSLEGTG